MKKIISCILFFTLFTGFSQEKELSLSLDEAINYALENNRNIKNAKRDIEAAEKQKWETTARGLPQINAKIDYLNNLKQQFDGIDFNQDGIIDFGAKQSVTASASLNQLIFDGSYLVGLQSAKVFLEISKNAKLKTDLEVRKAVINAYGNVLLAEQSVNITENNKAVLEKNYNETQKIYENGLTEEENVEQLQITLLQLSNNLKNAVRLRDVAYKMLNITIGEDVNTKLTLKDNLETLAENNINIDLLELQQSIENNIDYKIAENDKRSKELLVKFEKSKALPQLIGFLNGNYIGNNQKFDFLNSKQPWIPTAAFGVSLNIPIFSSLQRSAATQRAKINLEKSKTQLKETEQQLKFQVDRARSDYEFAIESYKTSKQNLALAERIEQKNQTKFFEGISTSFDLRQAQTQLYASQTEYLQAMLNVITKKAELETLLNKVD